jgi:hypothetical protein
VHALCSGWRLRSGDDRINAVAPGLRGDRTRLSGWAPRPPSPCSAAIRGPCTSAGTSCVTVAGPSSKKFKAPSGAGHAHRLRRWPPDAPCDVCARGCLSAASPRGLLPCCALGPFALAICAVQVYKTFKSFKLSDEPSELTESQLDDLRRILSYWAVMGCSFRLPCGACLLRCCSAPRLRIPRPCRVGLGADRRFPLSSPCVHWQRV